jgi:hypothetical protein
VEHPLWLPLLLPKAPRNNLDVILG